MFIYVSFCFVSLAEDDTDREYPAGCAFLSSVYEQLKGTKCLVYTRYLVCLVSLNPDVNLGCYSYFHFK